MGLLLKDNLVEGLVYLSNDAFVANGANFTRVSEISLFEEKNIIDFYPFIVKEIHRSIALKFNVFFVMMLAPRKIEFMEMFEKMKIDFKTSELEYKLVSQSKTYNVEMMEKL